MKLVNSTPNGQIFICPHRKKLHLEYGNLLLMLSYDEFNQFVAYVNSIDYQFYLKKNKNSQNKRKLLLNIGVEDNESNLTDSRLEKWVEQIKGEFA